MSLFTAALQALVEPTPRPGHPSWPQLFLDVVVPARVAGRRAWAADGRAAIEAWGINLPDSEAYISELQSALEEHPTVEWARANAPLGRMIVGLVDDSSPLEELVRIIDEMELRFDVGVAPEAGGARVTEPPVDSAPVERAATEVAVTGAGLVVAITGWFLHLRPFSAELAASVSVVDSTPRLRGVVEHALGKPRADVVISVANAGLQALAQGIIGLAVDVAQRALVLAEALAETTAWRAAVPHYLATAETSAASPFVRSRPVKLSPGPVEDWADKAGVLGLSIFGVATPVTGSGARAAGLSLATLPKPARVGREAFAAQLGRKLSKRGAVVLDPEALRRLDRIGTIVIDGDVLATGRHLLGTVFPLFGADRIEVAEKLHALFRSDAPESVQREGQWSLGPIDALHISGRRGAREQVRIRTAGSHVIGLARGARLMAVAGVDPEPHESLEALAAACSRCGRRVVIVGDALPAAGIRADMVLPGGEQLRETLGALQAEGPGLLLVSSNSQALASSDVGIGTEGAEGRPAWGGHILVGQDMAQAALLIEACRTASEVSRNSVRLAQAGTSIGGVAAAINRGRGTFRSLLAVNVAAAVALALGVRSAVQLDHWPLAPPVSKEPWHAMPVRKVMDGLGTSVQGLGPEEVRRRQRLARPRDAAPLSLQEAILEDLSNPMTPIVGVGAALSAAIGSIVDAALIAGVSILGAVIGGVERRTTDRALNSLMAASALTARVRRGAEEHKVPAQTLVPGDIIRLFAGEVVPADCRIVEATSLEADESSLTGEAFPLAKGQAAVIAETVAERSSMLYEGTTIAAGQVVAVVVATGAATEAGRAAVARAGSSVGGVEKRIAAITEVTLPITVASAATVVMAGLTRGLPLAATMSSAVSLAVAAVPEALPFLVTAAQLASARRLSAEGVLVRNPRTIEALGRVDVLCFDKTGTLTEGRIKLAAVCGADGEAVPLRQLAKDGRAALAAGLRATPEPRRSGKFEHLTDRAVTRGAADAGITRGHGAAGWTSRAVLPFEPARGYHATVGYLADHTLLSVKGSPEAVLPRCAAIRQGGREIRLDVRDLHRIQRRISRLAGQGYRVIAVAEATGKGNQADGGVLSDGEVKGLTLLGFLALSDPVREAAATSVSALRTAGVQIIMITGDHPGTASAVAQRLNLLNGGRVVTGSDLDALDDDALDAVLPSVAVVARGTPAHKVRVVQSFQRLHRTVAMTGDGANDAPAIRLADVGIALGHRATPAARAAADLVVTDDRLETIISALIEGRSMWGSARDALGILVGGNLGETAFTVLGAAVTGLTPLGARQLLLVNLLTDLAPALALALRAPPAASMQTLLAEGPETSLGSALTREVWTRAGITALGAGTAWLAALALGMGPAASTIALVGLVGTQLGQTLVSGAPTWGVIASGVGSMAVLATIIQVGALSAFFGSVPLGPAGWTVAAAACVGAVALSAALPRILANGSYLSGQVDVLPRPGTARAAQGEPA